MRVQAYVMCNVILNIFKAKFIFNLVATPFFLPTMYDASSERNAFPLILIFRSEPLEISQL